MNNLYNKGPFRNHEYGKITPYQKKYGNRKWRRTITSEIEDQLRELVTFRKLRKGKRKLIWIKITKKFRGEKRSDYKSFYTEKQFRRTVNNPHIIRYYIIKNKLK
ncbi:hypothetical protein CHRYSEOSP005_09310 [Chryseobacterium sp. Alg-005]|uniref:hypothetical protein n=1 Tax=Chryseobacterium sp. Alg-005 TaxID=3159516 RepID=UPI003555B0B5